MEENEIFEFLEGLQEEDWHKKVNEAWTVKDMVAHLVGWERESARQLPIIWQTKQKPWFIINTDWAEFNKRVVEEYKDYTPKQLMQEWYKQIDEIEKETNKIGAHNMKAHPELFDWYFEDTDFDETGASHYTEHLQQIKAALGK